MKMSQQIAVSIITLSSVFSLTMLSGCQHVHKQLIGSRGDIRQQQYRAAVFDPYALPEIGIDLGGMRPPEFDRPWPEPVRETFLAELNRQTR